MICPYPIHLRKDESLPNQAWYDQIVPCGKCGACRYNYQQDWIFRLRWEFNDPKTFSSAFYTFTYSDEHLHYVNEETGECLNKPTLKPKDLQDFWKRLRITHQRRYPGIYGKEADEPTQIRYYSVAEYGTANERPHFHAIIFNLHTDFLRKRTPIGDGWTNWQMEDTWGKGMCHFGEVTQRSMAYCAKFHMLPNNRYYEDGRYKEHARMSKHPYLGNYYERSNGDHHRKNEALYVMTPSGKKRRMPKIYKKKIFSEDEVDRIKEDNMAELTARNQEILNDLEQKGYEEPLEQYQKILKNKEQQVKRHAQRKKGLF